MTSATRSRTATDYASATLASLGLRKADQAKRVYRTAEDWIQNEFYIPERIGQDNPALQLFPHQIAALREAYRTDENGHFVYSIVVWSDIKKSAKSSIAAAVALERAQRLPYGSIKIIANDLKQADSRVAFYARRAIELNPRLTARTKVKPSGYKIEFDTRTVIEAVPVDPKGEAGGNDDLILFSELWAANQTAAQRMWTEMTLSPTKYGRSQRWVETYAGFSGESPLLEQLYEAGVKQGRRLDLSFGNHDLSDLEIYANDTARLLCLWNTKPRLPWQTDEYYAQEAAVLTPGEFGRVHRNQWSSSENGFVPPEWWDGCRGDYPDFKPETPVVIGMDAGVSNDCFAIVGVSRIGEKVYVRFVRVWKPEGGAIDFAGPEKAIREEFTKQYNVVQIAYDAYQLHDMATRLRRDGVAWLRNFNQGADRLRADKLLYDTIRDRGIVHQDEPTLTEHVKNANAQINKDDHTLRIIKRAPQLKIDACVALSMAVSEIKRLNVY